MCPEGALWRAASTSVSLPHLCSPRPPRCDDKPCPGSFTLRVSSVSLQFILDRVSKCIRTKVAKLMESLGRRLFDSCLVKNLPAMQETRD